MKLTEVQRRALTILSSSMGMMPGEFAERMWPRSPFWKVVYNVGRGASMTDQNRNAGMWAPASHGAVAGYQVGGLRSRPQSRREVDNA